MKKKKTKTMIFNFSRKKQFSTRLMLKDKIVESINDTKLLGTIICDNLKWNKSTRSLVKRVHSQMKLLRKVSDFSTSRTDRLQIYKMYVRSVVEQSCVV